MANELPDCKYINHLVAYTISEELNTHWNFYLIFEYLPGMDLFNFIESFKYHKYIIQQIFQDILSGLQILHSFDIAHRDIKPENIMIINKMVNIMQLS